MSKPSQIVDGLGTIYSPDDSVKRDDSWCIYQIVFSSSPKHYIGSTKNWANRVRSHFYDLKRNRHVNKPLQFAFNKYAKEGVWIRQIEKLDASAGRVHMLRREEFWIKATRSFDLRFGFNLISKPTDEKAFISKISKEQLKRRRDSVKSFWHAPENKQRRDESRAKALETLLLTSRRFVLYAPDNQKIEIVNLSKFCRDHGLDFMKTYAVATGITLQYKGWKGSLDRSDKTEKSFRVKSPEGQIHEGKNLKQFCVEHELPHNQMYNLIGKRVKCCHGWTLPDTSAEDLVHKGIKTFTLVHRDGREVTITNLSAWCRAQPEKVWEGNLKAGFVSKGWRITKRHE